MKKLAIGLFGLTISVTAYGQWTEVGKISSTGTGTIGTGNYNNSFVYISDGTQKLGIDPNQIYAGQELHINAANDLRFSTSDIERFRIANNGFIGIGTMNPLAKLSIFNTATIAAGNYANASIYLTDGSQKLGIDPNQIYAGQELNMNAANDLRFSISDIERFRIANNGFIGVGTTSPLAKLSIHNTATIAAGNYANASIYLTDGYQKLGIDPNQIYAGQELVVEATSELRFNTNSTERIRVLNNGNVGIGTTSPDAKLTVKGTIHTQEVKVDLNGSVAPDFVFEEDYALPELAETAAYIKANKHLPGIPSAQQMEEEGINLREMNLMLLQKVEELTLHLIAQEKRIQALEGQNNSHNR